MKKMMLLAGSFALILAASVGVSETVSVPYASETEIVPHDVTSDPRVDNVVVSGKIEKMARVVADDAPISDDLQIIARVAADDVSDTGVNTEQYAEMTSFVQRREKLVASTDDHVPNERSVTDIVMDGTQI